MPLEIRELVIKATVNNREGDSSNPVDLNNASELKINEIVDRVLSIIKEKSAR